MKGHLYKQKERCQRVVLQGRKPPSSTYPPLLNVPRGVHSWPNPIFRCNTMCGMLLLRYIHLGHRMGSTSHMYHVTRALASVSSTYPPMPRGVHSWPKPVFKCNILCCMLPSRCIHVGHLGTPWSQASPCSTTRGVGGVPPSTYPTPPTLPYVVPTPMLHHVALVHIMGHPPTGFHVITHLST